MRKRLHTVGRNRADGAADSVDSRASEPAETCGIERATLTVLTRPDLFSSGRFYRRTTMNSATQTLPSDIRENDLDTLNLILRGEISALETYESAMEKFTDEPTLAELSRIHGEHQDSVTMLRDSVVELGSEPSSGSGWWGTFTTSLVGGSKLLGPQTVLSTLKQGEDHGTGEYQRAIADPKLSAELKAKFSIGLAKCHAHISSLETLIAMHETK